MNQPLKVYREREFHFRIFIFTPSLFLYFYHFSLLFLIYLFEYKDASSFFKWKWGTEIIKDLPFPTFSGLATKEADKRVSTEHFGRA